VTNVERSLEFYTTLTPLVVVARNSDGAGTAAWLSNDKQASAPFVLVLSEFYAEARKRYGLVEREPIPIVEPCAHTGIGVPTKEDVDAIAERAKEMGVLHWEARQMAPHIGYICAAKDPDRNLVEFSFDQKVHSTIEELRESE
jgi:catechol 2,3-dioxygenase-like lactoylglutathione lyase family enzyme